MSSIFIWSYYIEDFSNEFYNKILEFNGISINPEIQRYSRLEDRIRKLIGRLMIQKALFESGFSTISNKIERTKENKPFIKNWYNFNLSYSNQYVVFIFSKNIKVGIDVEYHKEINYFPLLDYFQNEERQSILNSRNSLLEFYNIWTIKEAVLKASGIGLLKGINIINCTKFPVFYNNKVWYIKKISLNEKYTCNLAHSEKECRITKEKLGLNQLFR